MPPNSSALSSTFLPHRLRRIEKAIAEWWWVLLCLILCYGACEHAMRERERELGGLSEQLTHLQLDHHDALLEHEDLQMQVASLDDPQWVELTLMRVLGLVPEGQTKVILKPLNQGQR